MSVRARRGRLQGRGATAGAMEPAMPFDPNDTARMPVRKDDAVGLHSRLGFCDRARVAR